MKPTVLLAAFSLLFTYCIAQQNHFIYIQTENKQPFYIKIADRVLSSSSVGYLVVSKLQDGTHELNIGFPKNEFPQQKIKVAIKGKDLGYVLKNFGSKGWGLFNMETLDVIMAGTAAVSKEAVNEENDAFADVLADVVSTPSIKQKTVSKDDDEEKPEVKPEKTAVVTEVKTEPLVVVAPVRVFSNLDNSGRSIVYVDTHDNKSDTIRVFIPYEAVVQETKEPEKKTQPLEPVKTETVKVEVKTEPIPEIKKEEKKEEKITEKKTVKEEPQKDKRFLDIEIANPNLPKDSLPAKTRETVSIDSTRKDAVVQTSEVKQPDNTVKPSVTMINSDCKATADDDDFLKLRKKMAAQKTNENMIVVAKKAFNAKCYTVEQVNNLSVLFLNDEGRYNFFDAAYPRVLDSPNFGSLISKLTDEYYINRFKAMIRK